MKAKHRKPYVLLLDDNIDERFQTSMLLQQFGYNICTAHTAGEALDFLCVAPPVGIIAEAGLTGSGLLSRLTKDPRFSEVQLILLASAPDRALEDLAHRGELAGFLRKPIEAEGLYRAVQIAVEKTPRKNIRVATYLQASLEDGAGGREGFVTVLSEFGLYFRTLEPRPVRTRLGLGFEIPGRAINVQAEVLYSYAFNDGPFTDPGMGMKFLQMSPADQAEIKAYIMKQLDVG